MSQTPGERVHPVLPADAAPKSEGVRDAGGEAGGQMLAADVEKGALQVHHAGEEAPLIGKIISFVLVDFTDKIILLIKLRMKLLWR